MLNKTNKTETGNKRNARIIIRTLDLARPGGFRDEEYISVHEVRSLLAATKKRWFDNSARVGADTASTVIGVIEELGRKINTIDL